MWPFDLYATDSLKRKIGRHTTNMTKHNRRRSACQNPSACHWRWHFMLIAIYFLSINQPIDAQMMTNLTMRHTISPAHSYRGSRYTIDELINGKFTFKVSDDIDMDPCKASKYIHSFFLWAPVAFFSFDPTWNEKETEKIYLGLVTKLSLCALNCLRQISE